MYTWWRSWTRFRSNGSRSYILPLPPGTTFIILFCLLYTARSDHRQFDFSRHPILLLFYILTPPTTLTNNTCYMIITKQYLDMIGRHKKKYEKRVNVMKQNGKKKSKTFRKFTWTMCFFLLLLFHFKIHFRIFGS